MDGFEERCAAAGAGSLLYSIAFSTWVQQLGLEPGDDALAMESVVAWDRHSVLLSLVVAKADRAAVLVRLWGKPDTVSKEDGKAGKILFGGRGRCHVGRPCSTELFSLVGELSGNEIILYSSNAH
jgi:hypothetical protein